MIFQKQLSALAAHGALLARVWTEPWMRWAPWEAVFRASSTTFSHAVGQIAQTIGACFVATGIVGVVQMLGGVALARLENKSLWPGIDLFLWCVVFAFFATVNTIIMFVIFANGGDQAIYIFIAVGLSPVPAALMDNYLLRRNQITRVGWLGILFGVFGLYAMLNFPGFFGRSFGGVWWLFLSFCVTIMYTLNQAVTVKARKINGHVKNVWVGAFTALFCAPAFFFVPLQNLSPNLWWVSIVVGFCVIGSIYTNLMAYVEDAQMAMKAFVMNTIFLFLVGVAGILLFGEAFTWGKVVGFLFFIPAFALLKLGTVKIEPKSLLADSVTARA